MHRRGGHRAACSGLVGGQQNGSSMGSRLCKTEVVVTACWKGGREPTLPLPVARPAEQRASSRSHSSTETTPDGPTWLLHTTPPFPDHETRKTQTKHSVCPVGPALWMAAIKILRSFGPCRPLPSHLWNQHRCCDEKGRMLDARWRRRVGDDSHARWLPHGEGAGGCSRPPSRPSPRCAVRGPSRRGSFHPGTAALRRHHIGTDGSCRDARGRWA